MMRMLVVICAGGVAFSNFAGRNSYDWRGWNTGDNSDSVVMADLSYQAPQVFHSLALAPIADASETISPEEMERLRKEGEKATVVNQALVGMTNPTPAEFADSGEDVFVYTVQDGDTIGSIALKYNVTVNTIRWANGLSDTDMIHPGDQIFVLPVTGVRIVVKPGDSVETLAKKYDADAQEIISFNGLPANGELKEGDEIVIPDGTVEESPQNRNTGGTQSQLATPSNGGTTNTTPNAPNTSRNFNKTYYASGGHSFPWGWCTWYVASRRHVPWGGNAGTWLYHARAYGANIGRAPKPGAIMVSGESGYGHVAIVESVSGGSFTVSEMNYKGFGVVSKRTISNGAGFIKGFIY